MGQRLFVTIHLATDQVIEHVDSTIISLQAAGEKLSRTMKQLYPGEKTISLTIAKSP